MRLVYDEVVPPPAEQLGEPSRFSREPTQSRQYRYPSLLRTLEEAMRAPTLLRWVHLREAGGGFSCRDHAPAVSARCVVLRRREGGPGRYRVSWLRSRRAPRGRAPALRRFWRYRRYGQAPSLYLHRSRRLRDHLRARTRVQAPRHQARRRGLSLETPHQHPAHPAHGRARHLLWARGGPRAAGGGNVAVGMALGARTAPQHVHQLPAARRLGRRHHAHRRHRRRRLAAAPHQAPGAGRRSRHRGGGGPRHRQHPEPLRPRRVHRPRLPGLSHHGHLPRRLRQHHQPHRRARRARRGHLRHRGVHDVHLRLPPRPRRRRVALHRAVRGLPGVSALQLPPRLGLPGRRGRPSCSGSCWAPCRCSR